MRHLLALSRNRWKPVPYLFVNLMELTNQSSFKMPWNLRQILPLEGKKNQNNPAHISFLSPLYGWHGAETFCTCVLSFNLPDNSIRCFSLFYITGTYPESGRTEAQGRGWKSALSYPQTVLPLIVAHALYIPASILNSGLQVNLKE